MRLSGLAASVLVVSLASARGYAEPPSAPAAPAATPAPAPVEKKHGSRLPGGLLIVLGGAGLVSGGIFELIFNTTAESARSQCNGTVCPPSAAPDIAKAKNFEDAAAAALIAGGAIAAAGIVLTIVAPGDPVADEGSKSARLAPWVGPHGGGLGLVGTF